MAFDGLTNRVCFSKGALIFEQGKPGHEAFYLEGGKVELSHLVNGEKKVINVIESGAMFGEMALFAGGKRLLTAYALEPCECFTITPEFIQKKLDESPPFIRALLRVTVDTVQRLQKL